MGKNPAMLKLWFCCYIGIQYTRYSEIKLLRSLIQLYFCSNMKKKLHCVQITTYYILFHILQYILNYFILVSHTILELVLTHTKRLISIKFLGWSVTISVANNVFLKGILKIVNFPPNKLGHTLSFIGQQQQLESTRTNIFNNKQWRHFNMQKFSWRRKTTKLI